MTQQMLLTEAPVEKAQLHSDVQLLCAVLKAAHNWTNARSLSNWNERHLRAIANASDGEIISGQRGYCHIENATLDEIDHAANWLEHQAKVMGDRARAIRRRKHSHKKETL